MIPVRHGATQLHNVLAAHHLSSTPVGIGITAPSALQATLAPLAEPTSTSVPGKDAPIMGRAWME
jgi:hypothetical protein